MLRRFVAAAVFSVLSGVTVAQAQTVSQIGGPRELPPPGFKGQMYVDSRGCVFLRAGLNGVTNWVPRVSKDRRALCGYPPTMATLGKPVPVAPQQEAAPRVAVAAPSPRATGAPMATVATVTTPPRIRATSARPVDPALLRGVPAPVAMAHPVPPASVLVAQAPVARAAAAPVAVQSLGAVPSGRKIACYASAPVPKLYALSNGGTAVLCTRGDGSLNGAHAPIYARVAQGEGRRVGAGLYEPAGATVSRGAMTVNDIGSSDRATVIVRRADVTEEFPVPKGYKSAWKDDRLNPHRGVGTVSGQAAQDQIWTRDVPAQLVADQASGKTRRLVVVSTKNKAAPVRKVQVSSMGATRAPAKVATQATAGRMFVQVGTFGVPANAEGAKARLRAAGLPVGTSRISKGGKALQIVLAGPFGDAGSAQAALGAARRAGFGDAFIR